MQKRTLLEPAPDSESSALENSAQQTSKLFEVLDVEALDRKNSACKWTCLDKTFVVQDSTVLKSNCLTWQGYWKKSMIV